MQQPVDFRHLPDCALVRQKQLLQPNGPLPFSAVTLWRKVKNGTFPAPHRLRGERITAWQWGDVRRFLEAQTRQEAA